MSIFINTTTPPKSIFELIDRTGETVVLPNTVDVKEFLDNPDRVKSYAEDGKIVFHAWAPTAIEQWNKPNPMHSSAYGRPISYDEIQKMPEVLELAEIIDSNAIQKQDWLSSDFEFPEFPAEALSELGLDSKANRTAVFEACDRLGRKDIKDAFDKWYSVRLAAQHGSDRLYYNDEILNVKAEREEYEKTKRPDAKDFAANVSTARAAETSVEGRIPAGLDNREEHSIEVPNKND